MKKTDINNISVQEQNTSSIQNKNQMLRAVDEIWNKRSFDRLNEFVTDDFVIHLPRPGEDIRGIEGVKQFYKAIYNAFPNINFTVKDQVAESDKVVTHWVARGTHKGEFKGIPATGKEISISAIDIDHFRNGKVVECWTNMDELGLLQQLGAIPVPEQVK